MPKRLLLLIPLILILWLFNVSTIAARPASCLTACAADAPASNTLRVVTWNILHGFGNLSDLPTRLDLITAALQSQNPDIILLQEVPHTLRHGSAAKNLAQSLGMNYVYARANGNRWTIGFEEGEAILSRYPLSNPQIHELKPQSGFFEHRIALSVDALTPYGTITLYSTHLTNGNAEVNAQQAANLQTIVAQPRTSIALIGGDFNAQPDSPQITTLNATWQDAYVFSPRATTDPTCCVNPTDPSSTPSKRIDYLFIAHSQLQPIPVINVAIFPALDNSDPWPSDHLGIWAHIDLTP